MQIHTINMSLLLLEVVVDLGSESIHRVTAASRVDAAVDHINRNIGSRPREMRVAKTPPGEAVVNSRRELDPVEPLY